MGQIESKMNLESQMGLRSWRAPIWKNIEPEPSKWQAGNTFSEHHILAGGAMVVRRVLASHPKPCSRGGQDNRRGAS